jgi:predicted esterase
MLLHGVGSNAESFAPLMEALHPSIGAVAWNAAGYGKSKPLASEFPNPRSAVRLESHAKPQKRPKYFNVIFGPHQVG